MDEIFEICDEISVLRDGNLVMTKKAEDTNMNELITAMVGRSLESRFPPVDNKPGDTILSVQHLSTKYAPYLQDVTFDVKEGEIFGLYGLVGAGRTELLETIFGVRTRAAGRVYFKNRLMNFSSAKEAIDCLLYTSKGPAPPSKGLSKKMAGLRGCPPEVPASSFGFGPFFSVRWKGRSCHSDSAVSNASWIILPKLVCRSSAVRARCSSPIMSEMVRMPSARLPSRARCV